ncbi:protein kinase [Streptomyces sp. NPDC057496]|uniref:protein kinase domain-containing protein n=1 Tax=Streptomyces sp. NPDC057496 TaxID=3346149 RepID=UPI0036915B14
MEGLQAGDPRTVGPYRLLKRLGEGGMGQVFLGRSRGGRLVAVKVVRAELAADPQFRRRFAREVEAARQVGGFYTAQVVDADPLADAPWLVTAYIPGPSLREAVRHHGRFPALALERLAAGLAEGLAAVHACKMVHRDLKPGNVLLAADGPRLIDFGIARAADETQLTRTGLMIGTPGFMAPEHVVRNEAGPPADVFALGGVLVYAATGAGPFGEGAPHAVNYRSVHEDPDLTGLPASLLPLVADCLAKDPGDRPTVSEILDRVPVPDDSGPSWLPAPVITMIADRDVATVTGSGSAVREAGPGSGSGSGSGSGDPGVGPGGGSGSVGRDAGSGGRDGERDSGPDRNTGPDRDAAEARRAERAGREARTREQERGRSRERARKLLVRAEEVGRQISGTDELARTLAHLAAAVLPADPNRGGRLAQEAEGYARALPDPLTRVRTLAGTAAELAGVDRVRAMSMAERAETTAREIRGWRHRRTRREALCVAAEGMAPCDPARAERMVREIVEEPMGRDDAKLLASVARKMAAVAPDRAERIAVGMASTEHARYFEPVLAAVAGALAVRAPDRAERIARGLSGAGGRAAALLSLARESVLADPARAERIARSLSDGNDRVQALNELCSVLEKRDPDRAERIARSLPGEGDRVGALFSLAHELVPVDPDRAERMVRGLPREGDWAEERLNVVVRFLDVDPDRAERIARDIPADQADVRVEAMVAVGRELVRSDPGRAGRIFREAERIAREHAGPGEGGWAEAIAAMALVDTDPARARDIADGIADPKRRLDVLCSVADALLPAAPGQAAELVADCLRTAPAGPGADTWYSMAYTVEQVVREVPRRTAQDLAAQLAGFATEIRHEYRLYILSSIADMLADVAPESAAVVAFEALHTARSENNGDEHNVYSKHPLLVLALIDARQAAHLAVEPPIADGADRVLAGFVRVMVEKAAEHAENAG